MITFRKVKEPYGWLSNMSPHKCVSVGGEEYYTAEHMFQVMRFDPVTQADIVNEIRNTKSPMGCKMVAKKYITQAVVQPRSIHDVGNMMNVVKDKIDSNPELVDPLFDTGDELLVEDVSARPNESGLFWGMACQNGVWVGKNTLGNIWGYIRNRSRLTLPPE